MKLSIIIPVYNSEGVVGATIDEAVLCGVGLGVSFEIIAVNDGSVDGSWRVLCEKAQQHGVKLKVVNLLRNSGQHSALLCGMNLSRGEWVVTLDDDMQIHPQEIAKLMACASGETDLVVGQYEQKQHGMVRGIGSGLVQKLNEKIFGKPIGFTITSFRLMRRDVVDRSLQWRTPYPYINGLMLLCSGHRVNVAVEHRPRLIGKSGYNTKAIAALLMRILFTYSAYPLRAVLALSLLACVASFGVGLYFVARKLMGDVQVEGWTTVVALMAFLNSFIVVMLAMIGEYVLRVFRHLSNEPPYQIAEICQHPLQPGG